MRRLSGYKITTFVTGITVCSLCYTCKEVEKANNQKKNEVIHSLAKNAASKYSVQDAMDLYRVQGLSVAVIDNYELIWTDEWGVKDVEMKEAIDGETSFSVGSLAKPITATLLAILEEKGLINLRDPVSKYLKRWKLPDSKHIEKKELTFEHLLSHTSGATQSGFTDFYEGDEIPNLEQSLKGQIPGYDKEIAFLWEPGTNYEYSGGGYVIAQMAIEDSLQSPLAQLAKEHLFDPLDLKCTTMNQPNEVGFLSNVAKAHDQFGKKIRTGVPIAPQVAASGLWSNPTDLAKLIIALQRALKNHSKGVISNHVAKRVTHIVTSKVTGGWGLGWERRFGFCNYEWFSHSGSNEGTYGYMLGSMSDGKGIVIMGNSDRMICFPVQEQLTKSIMSTYEWYRPLNKSRERPVSKQLISQVTGQYIHSLSDELIEVALIDEALFIQDPFATNKAELIYIGDQTFLVDESVTAVQFERNNSNMEGQINFIRNITGEKTMSFKKL